MIKILIADDHPVVREGLSSMLSRQDDFVVVGEVANGKEAIREALALVPDVVLMDLRMPEVDGVAAIKAIRKANPDIAIVILTTYDDDALIRSGLQAGARGYLLKDAPKEQLFHAIRIAKSGGTVFHPAVADKLTRNRQELPVEEPLSVRELEVLTLLARGLSNKEIAGELEVSENTVKSHITHIFEKLNVSSRTEAVTAALKAGLLNL